MHRFAVLPVLGTLLSAQSPPIDFVQQLAPILQQRCVECHGAQKAKGKLRLDRRDGLFGGERERWTVRPGDAEGSELLRRVQLPADDDDVMPQHGERLTGPQVEVLRQWIAEGAGWPAAADAWFLQRAPVAPLRLAVEPLDSDGRARVAAALAELRGLGALAQPVAVDGDAVEVDLSRLGSKVGDAQLQLLRDLAPVLVWLDLDRTAVGDAGMAVVGQLRQLRRLRLSGTAVGDSGLSALGGLGQLEQLTLVGSQVTDQGLPALAGLGALRRLYVWNTAVTAVGAAALQQRLAELRIDRGDYTAERLAAAQRQLAEAAQRPLVNTTCPVTDKPVDPAQTIEFAGLRIGFCCQKCRAQFASDPKRFQTRIGEYRRQAAMPAAAAKKL